MPATLEATHEKAELRGRSCPVLVPERPVWNADYTGVTADQLVGLTEEQLATVDPLVVNLIVAKGIPSLSDLELRPYQEKVNQWAHVFATQYIPFWQSVYDRMPEYYHHNHSLFKVGMIAQYLKREVGISYNEEQRNITSIRYLNPADLFLNGVIDSLQGTCGNMATLHLAFAWRMGWQVSLACIHSHFTLRHDDGENVFNIETTCLGDAEYYWTLDPQQIKLAKILPIALSCGSELKALTPRERLGAFVGLRARHYQDLFFEFHDRSYLRLAERDYLLGRYLFPDYRLHCLWQMMLSALMASERFDRRENGHPDTWLRTQGEILAMEQGVHPCQEPLPPPSSPGGSVYSSRVTRDEVFTSMGSSNSRRK